MKHDVKIFWKAPLEKKNDTLHYPLHVEENNRKINREKWPLQIKSKETRQSKRREKSKAEERNNRRRNIYNEIAEKKKYINGGKMKKAKASYREKENQAKNEERRKNDWKSEGNRRKYRNQRNVSKEAKINAREEMRKAPIGISKLIHRKRKKIEKPTHREENIEKKNLKIAAK